MCLLANKRYKTYQTGFSFASWVMPQGWDLGVLWGVGGVNIFFSEIHSYMNGTCNSTIFGPLPPGALGRGQRSNIIKSQLLSQFQIFLSQTLCVFSQMKDIKHIRQDFHWVPLVMLKNLGLGGARGSKI